MKFVIVCVAFQMVDRLLPVRCQNILVRPCKALVDLLSREERRQLGRLFSGGVRRDAGTYVGPRPCIKLRRGIALLGELRNIVSAGRVNREGCASAVAVGGAAVRMTESRRERQTAALAPIYYIQKGVSNPVASCRAAIGRNGKEGGSI